MKTITDTKIMSAYMQDESRKTGTASHLFFPEKEEDVIAVFKENPSVPVTMQGARTGLTAGCVPDGGLVINMERMNRILDIKEDKTGGEITVQPGVLLQTLRQRLPFLLSRPLFFPPDPTETTASLGGMVSCNSSGARSFRYGAVRDYVLALDVILPDGDKLCLRRGENPTAAGRFRLYTCRGREIKGILPDLNMPQVKKHTAGYYIRPDMDLIDLFIGAEGTLGAITSIKLKLLPLPKLRWGALLFLPTEEAALELVLRLREKASPSFPLEALEFFGYDTLNLLRIMQSQGMTLREMERIPPNAGCAVYVEYTAEDRDTLMDAFQKTCRILSAVGGNSARTWAAINTRHIQMLRLFRHAAPECVNTRIRERQKHFPQITKLGTDMSVPDCRLKEVFSLYREDLQTGIYESAVFGHIGNNHVHVNILPRDMEEFRRGKELFSHWAKVIVSMGGTVSAEHGIGKLKVALLRELYTKEQLNQMWKVKKYFDPQAVLNRGNIFGFPTS